MCVGACDDDGQTHLLVEVVHEGWFRDVDSCSFESLVELWEMQRLGAEEEWEGRRERRGERREGRGGERREGRGEGRGRWGGERRKEEEGESERKGEWEGKEGQVREGDTDRFVEGGREGNRRGRKGKSWSSRHNQRMWSLLLPLLIRQEDILWLLSQNSPTVPATVQEAPTLYVMTSWCKSLAS